MDFPRLTPPAISVHDVNGGPNNPHSSETSRPPTSGNPLSSSGPLPIPSKDMSTFAPPPLPPPSRINDLENGHDAGWLHANPQGPPRLAPINPSSSLCGGGRTMPTSRGDPMVLDDRDGRQNDLPLSTSPETYVKLEPPRLMDGLRNPAPVQLPGPM